MAATQLEFYKDYYQHNVGLKSAVNVEETNSPSQTSEDRSSGLLQLPNIAINNSRSDLQVNSGSLAVRSRESAKMPTVAMRWYTKEHYWLEMQGDLAIVGLTSFQGQSETVDHVTIPKIGETVNKKANVGFIKMMKMKPIICPIDGKIIEINKDLIVDPSLLISSPLDKGWIMKIEIRPGATTTDLMNKLEYESFKATQSSVQH